jgi:transcriptional regulator with AAA-type ATPase domain
VRGAIGYTRRDVAGSSSPPTLAETQPEAAGSTSGEGCVIVRMGSRRQLIDVRDHSEVIIGRSSRATFVADDDRVSRRHLRLTWRAGSMWAEDLGSRNGTFLNGRKVDGETALEPADEVVVGPVRVTVCGRAPSQEAVPILGEGELWQRLSTEVERATRFERPLAVVGIRLRGAAAARREAALRIASRLRRIDLIGEYAAEEFLVLLPETPLDQATELCGRLCELAREVAGVSASGRPASVPADGTTPDELIAAAFAAGDGPTLAPPDREVLVADDAATRALFETARKAARSEVTVLITGETGAGKEVVAAEIHRASERADGPYVRLNCASIPTTLLESELFGHERGAFTGADRKHVGHIERAHGGTILFDEIGELPLAMQAKLLRVLEDRRIVRVGGWEEVPVDVRFLAATNRDLEEEVKRGTFREDLYFRLSAITLRVPPLRERPNEIAALAEHFALRCAVVAGRPPPKLGSDFVAALQRYAWPGNIRELRNVIERAVVLADGAVLELEQLPERLHTLILPRPASTSMREQMEELEKRNLREALRETGGNRTHAARKLGISRRALLYKLKKHGLE